METGKTRTTGKATAMGLCTLKKAYCDGDLSRCEAYKTALRPNWACYYYSAYRVRGGTPNLSSRGPNLQE